MDLSAICFNISYSSVCYGKRLYVINIREVIRQLPFQHHNN